MLFVAVTVSSQVIAVIRVTVIQADLIDVSGVFSHVIRMTIMIAFQELQGPFAVPKWDSSVL